MLLVSIVLGEVASGIVLRVCEWFLSHNQLWLLWENAHDCKRAKTIVTEIKTIARPGKIIASICKTSWVFLFFFCVLVQWDRPERSLDEGITRCIRQLLPGYNWVYAPLRGAWALPPCASQMIRANLISHKFRIVPYYPTVWQPECCRMCTQTLMLTRVQEPNPALHFFSAHSVLTDSQMSI